MVPNRRNEELEDCNVYHVSRAHACCSLIIVLPLIALTLISGCFSFEQNLQYVKNFQLNSEVC